MQFSFPQNKISPGGVLNTMNTNLAIETDSLSKFYGDFQAVDSVDLTVEKGCLYGFLGPNGAGKSTTIKMLTGILKPSSGSVRLLGGDPWNQTEALQIKKQIGVVPEDLALFDNLTAREYLTFVGQMHLLDKATILQRGEELLSLLKLEGVEKKLTVEYSHGMKKKLALAAALLPNPKLLFLDEPFEGVDVVTAKVIRDLLLNYVSKGSTVFVTSHVMEIVERICSHVGIIANGKLVEQCSLDDINARNSLENRFIELVGSNTDEKPNLDWLDGGERSGESATEASE
jgi:ABC-2 type transport system ATP-binding protein